MGPSAIRYARIEDALEDLGHRVTDLGNAGVPIPEMVDSGQHVKHLAAVKRVCDEVAERATSIVSDGLFPIFLGGDHSISHRHRLGVARSASGERTADLGPRPRRFQHPRDLAFRQHPRHAPAVANGEGAPQLVGRRRPGPERQDRGRGNYRPPVRGPGREEPAARSLCEGLHHAGGKRLRRRTAPSAP